MRNQRFAEFALPLLGATIVSLSACSTRYTVPESSERAILVLPTDGRAASMQVFRESADCSDRALASQGPDGATGHFEIPAGAEITVGTITDFVGGSPIPFVVVPGPMRMCRTIFTFTPKPGETYRVSEAKRADNCAYEVRDKNGIVDVKKRVPLGRAGHDLDPWCEEQPGDPKVTP